MVINFLRNVPKKIYNYLCKYGDQSKLHGPKYFLNHGSIEGGEEVQRRKLKEKDKSLIIDMSRFDR